MRKVFAYFLALSFVGFISPLTSAQTLSNQNDDINAIESDGTTRLMRAIYNRDTPGAKALIEAGADITLSNRYGITPSFLAARRANPEIMALLLNAGADPNGSTTEGETLLMTAAKTGNVQMLEILLSGTGETSLFNNANPNAIEGWKGQTALMWAAALGHSDAIKVLADHNANIDLHSAVISVPPVDPDHFQGGFVYSDIPRGRLTALHFAARQGQLESVMALINADANLDVVDDYGTSPLIMAAINGHMDIAGLLLNAGADPNLDDSWGRTILFVATDMHTLEANLRPLPALEDTLTSVDIVKLALDKGAEPNPLLKSGLPAWLAIGGSRNSVLNEGTTPFLRAAMSGDIEIMSILLEAGADPTLATAERPAVPFGNFVRPTNGRTSPFMVAAGVGWRKNVSRGREADAIAAMSLLINEHGADINAANQAGTTPLHGAVTRGSPAIIRFLAEHGADFNAVNSRELTPLALAEGGDSFSTKPIAQLLRELMSEDSL